MANYIFLTKNFTDEPTSYYAIPENKIETLNLSETYGDYGQIVGHTDAGDYHFDNEYSDAQKDCLNELLKKFTTEVDAEIEFIDDRNDIFIVDEDSYDGDTDVKELNEFVKNWREKNESLTEVEGFTFWDGHNWKTIVTSCDFGEPTHNIVDNEELIKELNKAIENKEFEKEGFGRKIYKAHGWVVIDSYYQDVWEEYEIVSSDEYEMYQTNY